MYINCVIHFLYKTFALIKYCIFTKKLTVDQCCYSVFAVFLVLVWCWYLCTHKWLCKRNQEKNRSSFRLSFCVAASDWLGCLEKSYTRIEEKVILETVTMLLGLQGHLSNSAVLSKNVRWFCVLEVHGSFFFSFSQSSMLCLRLCFSLLVCW